MLGLRRYKGTQIDIWQGDITSFAVDAIVNAANEKLLGGLGVDGAIHAAGGPGILDQCRKIGGCQTGEAVITTAGLLPAKHVIHAVGPVWSKESTENENTLKRTYLSIFRAAESLAIRHISIPAISTGAYGFPASDAAVTAFMATKEFLDSGKKTSLGRLTFVAFDDKMYDILQKRLFERFPDELDDEGF